MTIEFGGWAVLVHLAAMTQIAGYLCRDQLILRSLLLIGTMLYMAYYWLYPETPLWEPLFWGVLISLANTVMLIRIYLDRLHLQMSDDEARLFRVFHGFTPGMFRKLMAIGTFRYAESVVTLVKEGGEVDKLYFVIDKGFRISKSGNNFDFMPGAFVGEVVFLSGGLASATVAVPDGACYIDWSLDSLKKLCKKHPELKLRLESLMNQDLAQKVRFSHA
ncbi:cyclic nucleotide-binding domain-containing protein [bacterium]|nr:cyclic nucleotide-binding domain-containing protein [bacterium]